MIRPFSLLLVCLLCFAAQQASAQEKPAKKPVAANRYWSTNWSFDDIDLKDLSSKLKSIGVEVPVTLSGRASVNFDVSVPLTALRTGKAYRFHGTLKGKDVQADELKLSSVEAIVNYNNGVLTLSDLRGKQTDGTFAGTARMELLPQKDFEFEVSARDFDIHPVAQLLQKFGIGSKEQPVSGVISFDTKSKGKVSLLQSPDLWETSGSLHGKGLRVAESNSYQIDADQFELKDQRLSLPNLRLSSADLSDFFVTGSADVFLNATQAFQFDLKANDVPTSDLLGLYFDSPKSLLDGKLDLIGTASGRFVDNRTLPEFIAKLAIASPAVKAFGVDLGLLEHDVELTENRLRIQPRELAKDPQLKLRSLQADFSIDENRFQIHKLDAMLFGGALSGSAELARKAEGIHALKAKWDRITPKFSLKLPIGTRAANLSGNTSGSIEWSAPADQLAVPLQHKIAAKIAVNDVRMNDQVVGELDVQAAIKDDAINATAEGKLFGGTVDLKTIAPLDQTTTWQQIPMRMISGSANIADLSMGQFFRAVSPTRIRFDGRLGGKIQFVRPAGQPISTQSELILSRLTSNRVSIAEKISAKIETDDSLIKINSIQGSYAGGQIQANGDWSLGDGKRLITMRLIRADGDRALLPISVSANEWVGGRVAGRATIAGSGPNAFDSLRITGSVRVDEGTTFGIPVGDGHSPFTVRVGLSPLKWSASFPSLRSKIAGGQARGYLKFASGVSASSGFNMESEIRLTHVDFENLLHTYVGTTTIGHGDVSGDLRIGGRGIRDGRDLVGRFRMKLGGTDATAVPGLSATSSLLGATSLASIQFGSGEVNGRLSHGSVAIDELTMVSDRASFQASGRVGILDQRLDLKGNLSTGNFQGQEHVLGRLGKQSLLDYVPIGRANRLLSDRTVVFELRGPVRDPIIHLLTAETLQANARRFIVREAIGVIAVDSLLFD